MDVGAELGQARRARGLSLEELSARTKISVDNLEALEDNRLDELPPPLYVRGFLRTYAAEVHLDPNDVAERYFAQFDPAPAVEVLVDSTSIEGFPSEATLVADEMVASPVAPSSATPGAVPSGAPVAAPPMGEPNRIGDSGHIQSIDDNDGTDFDVPAPADNERTLRADAALAPTQQLGHRTADGLPLRTICVVALLAAAGGFLLAEYSDRQRSTSRVSPVTSTAADAAPPASSPQQDAGRERRVEAEAPVAPPAASTTGRRVPRETPTTSAAFRQPEHTAGSTFNADPRSTRIKSRSDSSTRNLSGWWTVNNRVQSTAYPPFENLTLRYRLKLAQKGDRISGTGHKWMENGRPLPRSQRTTIAVKGSVERQRVVLRFTERGKRRTSAGTFTYDISDTGTLQGTFASDVARSKGTSQATRMQPRE